MNTVITIFLEQINVGLMLGLSLGAVLLLYPLLRRVLTPQQRAWVWTGGWLYGWWNVSGRKGVFPVTFQDLVSTRTGRLLNRIPAFLPGEYGGEGPYHLALPGGALVRVELWDGLMCVLIALWAAGMAAMLVKFHLQCRHLTKVGRQGVLLEDSRRTEELFLPCFYVTEVKVYVSPGLPTSFVQYRFFGRYEIYIQRELPPEQLELVLCHEKRHIALWHCWWKVLATWCLVEFWWNPLVWLGFQYFCRDVEMACDESVMKRLAPDRRKQYAQLLVELGAGRQLWDVPLAFGESDSAARVRHLVSWRERKWWRTIPAWCAVLVLILFFTGGSYKMSPPQDMLLAWEREGGGTEAFVQALEGEMTEIQPELTGIEVDGVWEAPPVYPRSALWVLDSQGQWYRVWYVWGWLDFSCVGVMRAEQAEKPDLTDCQQLA